MNPPWTAVWRSAAEKPSSFGQSVCVGSQGCLLIFPGYTLFFFLSPPFPLLLHSSWLYASVSVCVRECERVLVEALRSSQPNRSRCTVGKQEAFVFFHGLQHSIAALSILPSISPTHLAPSPQPRRRRCVRVWKRVSVWESYISACPPLARLLPCTAQK